MGVYDVELYLLLEASLHRHCWCLDSTSLRNGLWFPRTVQGTGEIRQLSAQERIALRSRQFKEKHDQDVSLPKLEPQAPQRPKGDAPDDAKAGGSSPLTRRVTTTKTVTTSVMIVPKDVSGPSGGDAGEAPHVKPQAKKSQSPPRVVAENAEKMTDALFGAALAGDDMSRALLKMDIAKAKLFAERDKYIQERAERMARYHEQTQRFSDVRGDAEEDRNRLRADIEATQAAVEAAKADKVRQQQEAEQRRKYELQAEFRALRGRSQTRQKTDQEILAEQEAAAVAAHRRKREAKLALMKTLLKRQRLRMIIGRNNAAVTKANERLRRAVVKDHAAEAHRLAARLGLEVPADHFPASSDRDGPLSARPPLGKRNATMLSPRGRQSSRNDNNYPGVDATRSLSPQKRVVTSRGGARSASPSRMSAPAVEISHSKGAAIVIGNISLKY